LETPYNETTFQYIDGAESIDYIDDLRVKLTFGKETSLKNVLHDLAQIEGICDITSHKPDLHEIFLQLVKKQ